MTKFANRDYRGATIEDLNIPPAVSINPSTPLGVAIAIAYENEFTYLPVIHETNKRLLGVLNVEELKKDQEKFKRSFLRPIAKNYMLWFNQHSKQKYEAEFHTNKQQSTPVRSTILRPKTGNGQKYHVLTPDTPLEELAEFFNSGIYFAIITNGEGTFVYGVATPEDLQKYEKS
ncbi:uncharacterized protein SPAPADRAFT_49882 [Spathaspora passalidarum NRRL Y-27907]|uniref:CBS domain-containing protein n=1 Tax=Spathaspora passalidarum (strain NRRL Y-27907 / 11-Y1) TaxID=619300 RepID=G3AKP9_SPAPN|nr:uncharacterized protein SPAPADRAFT_49882 [Spathaspora passalidarum NRRL Y-27907]EGW32954.1 hypothetical protein SPAPADRAFT_49882 [Spathaspora passalidarum NRRL Y-27907]